MAETYKISALKRESSKKSARDTRNAARVPGVVYGSGTENVSISVDASEMLKLYRRAGTAAVVDLDIEGKTTKVLIHQMDLHPVRDEIAHIDFYAVNLKEATTVSVPLMFVGESPAVKNQVGTFIKDLDSLDIRCLPTDIPHELEVDISKLENIHDHFTVGDLKLDLGKFELMGNTDEASVICSITGRGAAESDEPMEEIETEIEGEEKEASAEEKDEE